MTPLTINQLIIKWMKLASFHIYHVISRIQEVGYQLCDEGNLLYFSNNVQDLETKKQVKHISFTKDPPG